ncbi:hypothetical protein DB346_01755 [Verrucomicrobia bacterium LW23]|nr:hypothetical protein DB346_01755 [Verrucomicrobia bacterium LW23]
MPGVVSAGPGDGAAVGPSPALVQDTPGTIPNGPYIPLPKPGAQDKEPTADGQVILKEALNHMAREDYTAAIPALDKLVSAEPVYIAYFLRAVCKAATADDDGAMDDVTKALEIRTTPNALILRGQVLVQQGKYEEGAQIFSITLNGLRRNNSPEKLRSNPESLRMLGHCTRGLGVALSCMGGHDEVAANYYKAAGMVLTEPEPHLYVSMFAWCLQARTRNGASMTEEVRKGIAADKEGIQKEWDEKKKGGENPTGGAERAWPLYVAEYLISDTADHDKLLAQASVARDKKTAVDQLCEAHYYIAMRLRNDGKDDQAEQHLLAAINTGARTMTEHVMARAELQLLKNPPEPAAPAPRRPAPAPAPSPAPAPREPLPDTDMPTSVGI